MQDSQVGVHIRILRGTFKKYVYLGATQEIRICNPRLRVKARELLSVKSSPRGFSYIQSLEKPLIPIRYPLLHNEVWIARSGTGSPIS